MKVTATVNVTVQRDDGTATTVVHTTPLDVLEAPAGAHERERGAVANAIDLATGEVLRRVDPDA